MNSLTETVVTIATAIVGVAILALIVSRKSNTAGVLQAAGSAFNNALGVAISPVTGQGYSTNLGYPAGMLGGGLAL